MFSIFESLFGKLFNKEGNVDVKVEGRGNVTNVINLSLNDKDTFENILKQIKKAELTQVPNSNNKEIIQELKNDILTNSDKMSIVDLINKAFSLANLKGDKEKISWLKYELSGYPDDYNKTPDYRKIKVRLDVGIMFGNNQGGRLMDLREYPLPIIYGGGLASLEKINEMSNVQISFVAPILPKIMDMIKTIKSPMKMNFDLNQVSYIIDRTELKSLIVRLKQEILTYVSSI